MSLLADLIARLKPEEGFVAKAYLDSVGVLTIGYGTNLKRHDIDARLIAMGLSPTMVRSRTWAITQRQAEQLLDYDAQAAITDAGDVVGRAGWERLPDVAKLVCADMVYNLGAHGFGAFHRMLAALRSDPPNYLEAAYEMSDSAWRHQVGQRARSLEELMRSCVDPPPESPTAA